MGRKKNILQPKPLARFTNIKTSTKYLIKVCLSLLLLLFTNRAMAVYTFPGNLPSGCTGSNGAYTCGALNLQDNVQFNDTTSTVKITVNGTLNFGGYTFGSASQTPSVTFVANGNVTMTFPTIYASISAGANAISVTSGNSPYIAGNLSTSSGNITLYGRVTKTISSISGMIDLQAGAIVSGAITKTSNNLYLRGSNQITSVTCSTCYMYVYGSNNQINGDIAVNYLDDSSTGSTYNGNVSVSSTSSIGAYLYIGYAATVQGSVSASSNFSNDAYVYIRSNSSNRTSVTGNIYATTGSSSNAYIYITDYATVNGNVTAYAGASNYSSRVEKYTSATINGSVSSTSATAANGSVFLYAGNVNGSVMASNYVDNYASVSGCIQSTNPGNLYLRSSSSAGGICCGSSGSCGSSCVSNGTSSAMPPLCTFATPTPIAYYHMDEAAWTGVSGEVKDSSGNNYHATVNKSVSTARPNIENTYPFIAGSPGTCSYSIFGGYGQAFNQITLPTSFPNLTGSFTFAAWVMAFENNIIYRVFTDDANNSGGYGLSLADAGTGTVRFFKRLTSTTSTSVDTPSVIQNNIYYFIAVSVDSINQNATIYVYDTSGTLVNKTTGAMSYFGASDPGQTSIATIFNGTGLHGRMDEVSIYTSALTQLQIQTLRAQTHACPGYNVMPTNFNCVAVGAASNSGHLYTQVSNGAFSIDLVALKVDGSTETSYVASGTKNVTLEFVDGSGSTVCGSRAPLSPAISQTVTFAVSDAGRKTVNNINIAKAYRDLRCRVTDANQSPNVVGCSYDDFAVRPTSFTVTSSNANADSAGTSALAIPAIKTGANFSLTAATGIVGYDNTPIIDASKLGSHSGAIQTGNLSNGFGAANSATGSATGSSFTYSEVGYFSLAANGVYDSTFTAVDSANGDCNAGYTASGSLNACSFGNNSATNYFGRFIPDHFAISLTSTTPACSNSFTYFGQDGLSTAFTLTAQNSSNNTTNNYIGSFAKFGLTSWASYSFSAATLPAGSALMASSTAPTGIWSNGSANIVAKHVVSRPSSATIPTNIIISASPVDSDGVAMTRAVASASSSFKYGRLYMPNTYGSELLSLPVPLEAQYWNGTAYQRNQQDSCSVIPPSSIAMSNYKSNLAACETALTGAGKMNMGKVTAILSKPGSGNNGSVDLTVNVTNASGSYCSAVSAPPSTTSANATSANTPWLSSTPARATFGLYKTPIIYFRENF